MGVTAGSSGHQPRTAKAVAAQTRLRDRGPGGGRSGPRRDMERSAGLALSLRLVLALLGGSRVLCGDTHSLSCIFTVISNSRPGHPWCEVQVQVDQKPFLYYDCGSHQAKPLGPLGEKVNTTKVWTELSQTLEDVVKELRMTLPDIRLEQMKTKGPPTLQAQMFCQHEADHSCKEASWKFSINGQTFLFFDSIHTNWSAIHPGAGGIKEKWESNRALAEHLGRVSKGDCSHWLQEFLEQWKKMPELIDDRAEVRTVVSVAAPCASSQLLLWLITPISISILLLLSS